MLPCPCLRSLCNSVESPALHLPNTIPKGIPQGKVALFHLSYSILTSHPQGSSKLLGMKPGRSSADLPSLLLQHSQQSEYGDGLISLLPHFWSFAGAGKALSSRHNTKSDTVIPSCPGTGAGYHSAKLLYCTWRTERKVRQAQWCFPPTAFPLSCMMCTAIQAHSCHAARRACVAAHTVQCRGNAALLPTPQYPWESPSAHVINFCLSLVVL